MSTNTGIEWTDMTWNPVVGCTRVSAGCDNCYAIRQVHRMGHNPNTKVQSANAGLTHFKESRGALDWSGTVRYLPERLDLPLRLKKPQLIFVNSLSDLFHERLTITQWTDIFEVMAKCPHLTFQILTKRAENLFLLHDIGAGVANRLGKEREPRFWPLPNVWLGVSVEDQETADERIPLLLQTPAAVRFLSCEPLLSDLVFQNEWFYRDNEKQCRNKELSLHRKIHLCPECAPLTQGGIDWVIVGGESGPGARPMHPDWVRSIRDQCKAAGVPFFFKQWGEWYPFATQGDRRGGPYHHFEDGLTVERVGKKAAGRLLDGREWNAMPNC